MVPIDPLPFRLKVPGRDTLDWHGASSISYRLEGLLHLSRDTITLEWAATRRTQRVSLTGVKDEVDRSPIGSIDVPVRSITHVRLRGGWWAPRLQLWARQLDTFEGIPGFRPATVTLRVHRRDRERAHAFAMAIHAARVAATRESTERPLEIGDTDVSQREGGGM